MDHIVPLDLEGSDDLENLSLARFHCNRRKSNRIEGIDRESGDEVALFNPRASLWSDHFVWAADAEVGHHLLKSDLVQDKADG